MTDVVIFSVSKWLSFCDSFDEQPLTIKSIFYPMYDKL